MLKLPYQKLIIWQKAMLLAKKTYELTKAFPQSEIYGLVSKMRKAAVSVASNIAEGSQRGTDKGFRSFVLISLGSLIELETQFLIAIDLGYMSKEVAEDTTRLIRELARMMSAFIQKLTADR